MKNKLSIKDYLKIVLFAVVVIVASTIFSEWDQFEAGFFNL